MTSARGYALIAGAACCWGAAATLGRGMFTGRIAAPVSPLILTETRIGLAAAVLLPVLVALRGRAVVLPWRDALGGAALGVVGMSTSNYFYYLAIARTNVATAIILQYTAPVWVLLYLLARGRQRGSLGSAAAVGLALGGIALVLGLGRSGAALRLDGIGVAAAMVAAFAFAYYNLAGEALTARVDPLVVSLYMLVGAALFWFVVHPPWLLWQARYSGQEWLFFLGFSLLATLAPTLLYLCGLRHLDPTRAVVTSCLEPVSGILLAAAFLGESLDAFRLLGVGCVLAAIVLIQREEAGQPRG